jgi:uncharacterized protein YgiM (DUF1202 family)
MNWKTCTISLGIMLLLVALPLMVIAQDTSPTAIPVLPDSTQESAAPEVPDIAPPVISGDRTQETQAEATAAVEDSVQETVATVVETTAICPVAVQDSFTATEILCTGLSSGEACIGNGNVDAVFGADISGISFSQANDRVRLTSLDQLSLDSSSGIWTVVSAKIELISTGNGASVTGTMLVFGDVTMSDAGQVSSGGAQNATVIAQRGMNVRRTPANDGVVVWQLQPGEQVMATGITVDRVWIRIIIPNEFQGTGWVYAPYLEVEGGVESLAYVTADSPQPNLTAPEFGAMQSIELLSGLAKADCGSDIPDSGILLQSPSGFSDGMRLKVNGVEIQLNGTAFLTAQAGGTLAVNVLEGQATAINGSSVNATAGNRISIPLDSNLSATGTPTTGTFDSVLFDKLPTRLLPRQFAFGMADTSQSGGFVAPTASAGFGTPAPTAISEPCTLTALETVRNIRSGPSTDYETVRVLQLNESVLGIGQAVGELSLTWYQTDELGWVRIDAISASSSCNVLPIVNTPPPPTATAIPDLASGATGLSSSQLGDIVCNGTQTPSSTTSDGSDFSVEIGGTWTVSAGTSVSFVTGGGQLRPEFGNHIQLIGSDGSLIADSGDGLILQVTFEQSTTFSARFSAGNGDVVVMAVSCQ